MEQITGHKPNNINLGKIELTDFARRQWKPEFAGTKMNTINEEKFIELMNVYSNIVRTDNYRHLSDNRQIQAKDHPEWEFCKYLIFDNTDIDIKAGAIKLSLEHYPFIRTGYGKRTESELPFLSRWLELPHGFKSNKAEAVCIVLYSKAQLQKEHESNETTKNTPFIMEADYGIVAILGLPSFEISPPPPMTILRNALGKEYGGNGQPINTEEYLASVKYWDEFILCK